VLFLSALYGSWHWKNMEKSDVERFPVVSTCFNQERFNQELTCFNHFSAISFLKGHDTRIVGCGRDPLLFSTQPPGAH
jgi:hypothetical protein